MENGADGVAVLDHQGNLIYITPSIEHILGYTIEEALNLNLFERLHPDDAGSVQGILIQAMERPGVPIKGPLVRLMHKNGTWRYLDATITDMIDNQSIGGLVDNFRDVTNLVLAENAKDYERHNNEALINSTEDLIWSVDANFKLITANKSFLDNLQRSTGQLLQEGDSILIEDVFSTDFLAFWSNLYQRALIGESFQELVYTPVIGDIPQS